MIKDKKYSYGEIQSFRRFPSNYFSMNKEEKEKCDEKFYESLKNPNEISEHLFYYCEIIFEKDSVNVSFDTKKSKTKKSDLFIAEAKEIHGDKYEYDLVKYQNAHKKVAIKCKKHGVFNQRPTNHVSQKQGCPSCGKIKTTVKNSLSTNEEYSPEFLEFLDLLK